MSKPRPFSNIGYAVGPDGVERRALEEGEAALYWTGELLEARPFVGSDDEEFGMLAALLSNYAPTRILDVGAGEGQFADFMAQRHQGVEVISIDRKLAPRVARMDMDDDEAWRIFPFTDAVAHTNVALFAHDEEGIVRVFRSIVRHCRAGVHREFCGAYTALYAKLCKQAPGFDVYRKNDIDVFGILTRHADDLGIVIDRHIQIPPHFLHQHVPSVLTWHRDNA